MSSNASGGTHAPPQTAPGLILRKLKTRGNYGNGLLTGMTAAAGTASYVYDNLGRLTGETRTYDSVDYETEYTYYDNDTIETITYPTDEVVTNDYNGRGLPDTLSGSVAGNLVTGTSYNQLGQITKINLYNGLQTTFGYWGVGGAYDTAGGYYGRLWRITIGDATDLLDVKYTWDAGGNLTQREDVLATETESFTYDYLDRLTAVSGPYSQTYAYDEIGNITSMNGTSYTYGSQPHAVTAAGTAVYVYDNLW